MQKDNSFFFLSSLQCDAVNVLEKEHDYRDEHFDFIQSHLRRFCLQCILGVLFWGPGAQASLQVEHLQGEKYFLNPERFCQGDTVYIFLLVLYFTMLEFET